MELKRIINHIDSYLNIGSFKDDSINGLQVENSGFINKIGLAVDACQEAIYKAEKAGCNLLIVHHGLFWNRRQLIVGNSFQRIRALIMADMALYAVHIPLDAHPEIGHNRAIARLLDLDGIEPFAMYHGSYIGIKGRFKKPGSREQVAAEVEKAIGSRRGLLKFGPEKIDTVAVVAGSATDPDLFKELKDEGIDLFITGEPKHGAYHLAQEFGLNIFYGGHYQTETFGIKALGDYLHKMFSIPVAFIDAPCFF
ncbi:MAG: putative GTP cyclohydrolase 1 type 2 [Syntrophus sp. PtaB.Bin001]|nr:MAG: putative GTP cyclohydrolase 1 type 2 [Syntrophus sp. PtaB.Bin001]